MELHKVPACQQCNNPAGVDDEEFKLIIGLSTGEFRSNGLDIVDSMGKTIAFNKRLARQIFLTQQRGYADRGTGFLEPVVAVSFTSKAYQNVISRMVRALFWREERRIMHPSTQIQVTPATELSKEVATSFNSLMQVLEPNFLNDKTFAYKYVVEHDGASILGMQFFGKHTAFASPSQTNITSCGSRTRETRRFVQR